MTRGFFIVKSFVVTFFIITFACAMQRLMHLLVYLKRIAYCRGFGIQSPTDYWIVRYDMNGVNWQGLSTVTYDGTDHQSQLTIQSSSLPSGVGIASYILKNSSDTEVTLRR